jgi:hypothetical protein
MDVTVDNVRNVPLEGNPADIRAAITALSSMLRQQGRIIQALKIDGQELRADNTESLLNRPVTEVATLEAVSEDLSAYAGRLLEEMQPVLPELSQACHDLAAVFQGNQPEEGFEPFQRLAEIWSVIKSRELEVAELLGCSLDDIRVDGMPVQRMHDELNRFLEEAADALTLRDCVLLGDLLEYELAPRARQEVEIVSALCARAAQRP